jgi:hypothetical protein
LRKPNTYGYGYGNANAYGDACAAEDYADATAATHASAAPVACRTN